MTLIREPRLDLMCLLLFGHVCDYVLTNARHCSLQRRWEGCVKHPANEWGGFHVHTDTPWRHYLLDAILGDVVPKIKLLCAWNQDTLD
jgi:hypothetical protein